MTSFKVARFAFDRHRVLWENRGRVEESAVVLAAVETVADADAVRLARRPNSNVAA